MNVTEAVRSRRSIRAFMDTRVDADTLRHLLETASRAPSGGNVQPWRVFLLQGDAMDAFPGVPQRAFRSGAAGLSDIS